MEFFILSRTRTLNSNFSPINHIIVVRDHIPRSVIERDRLVRPNRSETGERQLVVRAGLGNGDTRRDKLSALVGIPALKRIERLAALRARRLESPARRLPGHEPAALQHRRTLCRDCRNSGTCRKNCSAECSHFVFSIAVHPQESSDP